MQKTILEISGFFKSGRFAPAIYRRKFARFLYDFIIRDDCLKKEELEILKKTFKDGDKLKVIIVKEEETISQNNSL
jgi:hypothetical protein